MLAPTNGPLFRYTLSMPTGLLPSRLLKYEPTGWDGMSLQLSRDFGKRQGVTTEYSNTLTFVKDGAAYLLKAYRAAGVQAQVNVLIEQLEPNEFSWQPYYAGRVNWTTAEFTATGVKVNLEQQGWLQKFLSRDSVQVDLLSGTSVGGSTGPSPLQTRIQLHSRAILQRYAASQKVEGDLTSGSMYGGNDDASHEQLLYFGYDTTDANEIGLGAAAGGFVSGAAADAVPIWVAPGPTELTIDFALYFHVEAHAVSTFLYRQFRKVDAKLEFRVQRASGAVTTIKLRPDIAATRLLGDYTLDEAVAPRSYTLTLDKDDAVYLYAVYWVHDLDGGSADPYQATISCKMRPGSYLRMTAISTTQPTETVGLLLYEAFERLCQALTDEVDVFRSDFFGRTDLGYPVDGPGALALLTGGFQVRGFPLLTDPAPAAGTLDLRKSLTATWQQVYESADAEWCLGWGVEWSLGRDGAPRQVIRVEPLAYWYPKEVVLDLTAAGPLVDTLKVHAPALFQVVEMNYAKWQAESANGLDEFNSTRQWTTPLDAVTTTYTRTSQLLASGTLLEATRRKRYDVATTTDTSQDEANFLVCVLRLPGGGYETERNQRCVQLSGVLSPATVYNVALSPARRAIRHAEAFLAGIAPTPGAQLRYTAGEGNVGMVSLLQGEAVAVAENATLAIRDLPRPRWRAEQASIKEAPVSRRQLAAVLARPRGRVRYRSQRLGGQIVEGWLLDFTHKAQGGKAELSLLPCAS